ncbi:MAG: hypothetical protein Q9213_002926 [Squamulea squamosa]
MTSTIGIPIKLLNEAQNHVVTLEITSGQVYRGKLIEAEDNMNVQLKDITVTARDGRVSHLDQVYIRGSHVRFFIVPDMLRNAPMFRSRGVRGRGVEEDKVPIKAKDWNLTAVNGVNGANLPFQTPTTMSPPPSIRNPLRALVLTASPSSPIPSLLQGSELLLTTPYYSTTIPIWHDNISPSSAALQEWENEWSAPEAGEVIQSLGAWVVVVRKPSSGQVDGGGGEKGDRSDNIRKTLTTVHKVIAHHRETSNKYSTVDNEPLFLVIGMPQPLRPLLEMSNDEWEDLCLDCGGWQWIDSEAQGKNQFGETVGLERLQEALEANEWDGGDLDAEEIDFESELDLREGDDSSDDIQLERDDVVGIREAILEHDGMVAENTEDDAQVEELESMMLKMQAIKGSFQYLFFIE